MSWASLESSRWGTSYVWCVMCDVSSFKNIQPLMEWPLLNPFLKPASLEMWWVPSLWMLALLSLVQVMDDYLSGMWAALLPAFRWGSWIGGEGVPSLGGEGVPSLGGEGVPSLGGEGVPSLFIHIDIDYTYTHIYVGTGFPWNSTLHIPPQNLFPKSSKHFSSWPPLSRRSKMHMVWVSKLQICLMASFHIRV